MKFTSPSDGRYELQFDDREYDALMAVVGLRVHLSRSSRSLTTDTAVDPRLRAAQDDFDLALVDHRQELSRSLEALLKNPEKSLVPSEGVRVLTLSSGEMTLLLQGLNEVRVAAWEHLGSPDFDIESRPEVNDDNFLFLWAIQATDLFQSFLLSALEGETENPGDATSEE